jgi:hypothetical protein
MSSFIGRLFGSSEAAESAVQGVVKGLDALVYTEEEKAGDAAVDRKDARNMFIEWYRANSGSNLARRFLAISVSSTWLFLYLLAAALDVAAVWAVSPDMAMRYLESSTAIGTRTSELAGPVMMILGFYFAAPYMGDITKRAVERFLPSK